MKKSAHSRGHKIERLRKKESIKTPLALKRRFSIATLAVVVVLAGIIGLRYVFRAHAASPPVSGGYYQLTAPGTAFKDETTCASEVLGRNNPWEPHPENNTANHTLDPNPSALGNDTDDWNAKWNNTYKPRITGNFQGTTDQIFQWAACKWGWSDDMLRAEAIRESSWDQANTGDFEPRSAGHCPYDIAGDPCPTSYGILQTKWYYHPPNFASDSPQSSYPWIRTSTAFEVDEFGAMMRGCYDGLSTYLGPTTGNAWGCVGTWYSGGWDPVNPNNANWDGGDYVTNQSDGVKHYFDTKPWLTWADKSGGDSTPPSVNITSPAAGGVNGVVTITAAASDNVGVVGVQFKVDGANVGSEDTSSPYSYLWNTASVSNGNHIITAVARDAAGNTKTSASVTVTVNNAGKPGDINGDGSVGIADLSILASHFGQSGTLSQGDLSGDGIINIADLSILATYWGT